MLRYAVVLVVTLTYSDVTLGAKYCCYPPTWESLNFFREAALKNGTLDSKSGEEMVSVDTTVSMVNSYASIMSSGQTTSIRTIQDWAKGKQYVIIGEVCTVSTLPGPYANKCVPDDANVVAPDLEFGINTRMMPVEVFQIVRGNMTAFVDVVKPDCIPMAVSTYGSTSAGTGMSVKLYTNFTLGIKDRSVFTIPTICNHPRAMPGHHVYRRSVFDF